jgi:hypothetical protein
MALFPLGILSAAGASVGGDFELISTALGTGSSGVIEFTSIPSTYRHLQIRYSAKNTSTNNAMGIRMNGITSSSYGRTRLTSTGGATLTTESLGGQTIINLPESVQTTTGTGFVSGGVIEILDYSSTTKNTTVKALTGSIVDGSVRRFVYISGLLVDTSAVTTLSFIASANSFATLSQFSLYGIR